VTPEERGAKLLDEKYEGDWREKIDIDELDMDNQDECILGQMYGDYEDGLEEVVRVGVIIKLVKIMDLTTTVMRVLGKKSF
jgi:hypothetical protein